MSVSNSTKRKKMKSTANKKKRSKHVHRIFFVNHLVHIKSKTVHSSLKIAHVLGILEEGDGNLGSKSCQHI